eukprot:NODE_558_length_1298_cov_61.090472_g402_i0.p1 GENE.NODE_558_length_1298_cov_61.090472_g402_i0~~NODE_558_length_1298_cov_61.090472_g402_i0.p1  ORF type:complete len:307 (+),score=117.72 NODE_558_length_1298_cov_61.090472_g402_i0:55-921(+)
MGFFEISKEHEDPFRVLDISRSASDADIKKAYRTLSLKYHPDKLSGCSDKEKDHARKRFVKVTEAYETLLASGGRFRVDAAEAAQKPSPSSAAASSTPFPKKADHFSASNSKPGKQTVLLGLYSMMGRQLKLTPDHWLTIQRAIDKMFKDIGKFTDLPSKEGALVDVDMASAKTLLRGKEYATVPLKSLGQRELRISMWPPKGQEKDKDASVLPTRSAVPMSAFIAKEGTYSAKDTLMDAYNRSVGNKSSATDQGGKASKSAKTEEPDPDAGKHWWETGAEPDWPDDW